MNILHDWVDDLTKKQDLILREPCAIRGEFNKHLGPMWMKAGATAVFAPCDFLRLETQDLNISAESSELLDYVQGFLFGAIDATTRKDHQIVTTFSVRMISIDVDPVESSIRAFRMAGRNAGEQLLEILRERARREKE